MSVSEVIDEQAWDSLVMHNNGHPLQLSGWGKVKKAHGWETHRVQLSGSQWRGAQILLRSLPFPFRSIAYVPRGGAGQWNAQDYDELARYVKTIFGSVCLTIEPDNESIDLSSKWKRSPNHILIPRTLILDLTKTEDELLADISSKRRYDIRKSTTKITRFGTITTKQEFDACLELYHQTAARAGFPLHDDVYYRDIFEMCAEQSCIMAAWGEKDELLAFTWFVVSEQTAFELYSGINDTGQQIRANYGLKWWCITEMRRRGVARYDFNGLLNDGISSFKKSFGSTETILVGSFDASLSPWYGVYSHVLPTGKKISRNMRKLLKR